MMNCLNCNRSIPRTAIAGSAGTSTRSWFCPLLFLFQLITLLGNFVIVAGGDPNLPFGDINLLILTDVHSWVGGHHGRAGGDVAPTSVIDADYGNVLSFYEHLKAYCDEQDKDFWFVMNGDWIDGTGLAMDGDPSYLVPILQKMPWDVLNTGNHEMYRASVIEYMRRPGGFLDWWGERHLASNIVMNDNNKQGSLASSSPLSNKYLLLKGRHSTVLVFGFLYNLPDPADIVTVQKLQDAVQEDWFRLAVQNEEYDAILVMAHMSVEDPSVTTILNAVRQYNQENIPIQFVTGHTHLRRYGVVDDLSTSFEAGKYLDTIGLVSFPNVQTVSELDSTNATSLFEHVFIDASQRSLQSILDTDKNSFETPNGKELSLFIQTTQQKLGLDRKIGCAPQNYYMDRTLFDQDSLWGLFKDKIVPTQLDKDSATNPRAIFVANGSWRYDLLAGPDQQLVYDDIVAVSPFDEPIYFLGLVPGSIILALNETLNPAQVTPTVPKLPTYTLAGTVPPVDIDPVELYCKQYSLQYMLETLKAVFPEFDPDVKITNLTSTNIWEGFVLEQWPCPGDKGVHVPWFNNDNNDDDEIGSFSISVGQQSTVVSVVTAVLSIILLCGALYIVCVTIRQFCCGFVPIGVPEFDPIKEQRVTTEDEDDQDDDSSPNDDDKSLHDRDEDEGEFSDFA